MRFVLVHRMCLCMDGQSNKHRCDRYRLRHGYDDDDDDDDGRHTAKSRKGNRKIPMVCFTKMIIELKIFIFRGCNQHDVTRARHNFRFCIGIARHTFEPISFGWCECLCLCARSANVMVELVPCWVACRRFTEENKVVTGFYWFAVQLLLLLLLPLVSAAIVFTPLTRSKIIVPKYFRLSRKLTRCQWAIRVSHLFCVYIYLFFRCTQCGAHLILSFD